jgi:hypothetical protein
MPDHALRGPGEGNGGRDLWSLVGHRLREGLRLLVDLAPEAHGHGPMWRRAPSTFAMRSSARESCELRGPPR